MEMVISGLIVGVPSFLVALFTRSALVAIVVGAVVAGAIVMGVSYLIDESVGFGKLSRDTATDLATFVPVGAVAGLVAFGLKRLVRG
jgi:hypothetical protein